MKFKPLVSEDEFRAAEADIEAATRELARRSPDDGEPIVSAIQPVVPPPPSAPTGAAPPEIRTRIVDPSLTMRIMAMIGMGARLRRVHALNKIARTVDFACAAGLKGKSFETVAGLYSIANDARASDAAIPVILGWIQAITYMTCPSATAAEVQAL
jgi:hypothetical protein